MRLLFPVFFLFFSTPLFAARSYAIDLLIFQRLTPDSGEVYLPADDRVGRDIQAPSPTSRAAHITPLTGGPLAGVAARLSRSPAYRVLWHRFWRQPVAAARGSFPMSVDAGSGDRRVEGAISLSARHYLHLDVDLVFHHDGATVPFKAHQRMRSGKTYYIDHPLGGIIVRVVAPKAAANGE